MSAAHPPEAGTGHESEEDRTHAAADAALRHHGDADLADGLVDLAVNVHGTTPPWLQTAITASLADLAGYPSQGPAISAVAARHGRDRSEVLLTAGAAEAFVLIARALSPAHAVVVHPQFTEPEAALRAAGHPVHRVELDWPYTLDPTAIPTDADLVVIGNPTNPTSILHPASALAALARPGRFLVVDEAFADCVPGEPESLAGRPLPGLIVVRSLTKTWALAGLRCGYLLAEADVVTRLAAAQPLWPVSTPALAAIVACSSPQAVAAAEQSARVLATNRTALLDALTTVPGVDVVPAATGSFVLLRYPGDDRVRQGLRSRGFAPRRGDTFPGLGEQFLRIAVRDPQTSVAFADALRAVLDGSADWDIQQSVATSAEDDRKPIPAAAS